MLDLGITIKLTKCCYSEFYSLKRWVGFRNSFSSLFKGFFVEFYGEIGYKENGEKVHQPLEQK